MVRDAL
jgi:cell division protease FtsH